jgi:hypothetical protein
MFMIDVDRIFAATVGLSTTQVSTTDVLTINSKSKFIPEETKPWQDAALNNGRNRFSASRLFNRLNIKREQSEGGCETH